MTRKYVNNLNYLVLKQFTYFLVESKCNKVIFCTKRTTDEMTDTYNRLFDCCKLVGEAQGCAASAHCASHRDTLSTVRAASRITCESVSESRVSE